VDAPNFYRAPGAVPVQDLPDGLQHLKNIIDGAKTNHRMSLLRGIIKHAADSAPGNDIIRIAETILQCGIDIEIQRRN